MAQTPATLDQVVTRIADLEAARAADHEAYTQLREEHARQREEIAALRRENGAGRRPAPRFGRQRPATPAASAHPTAPGLRTSRRGMLGTAARVAVATAAAGVLAEQVGTRPAFASGPGTFDSNVSGTPAVSATGTSGADGLDASSDTGYGAKVKSTSGTAVYANSTAGYGVYALGGTDGVYGYGGTAGIYGYSAPGDGVYGTTLSASHRGVYGTNTSTNTSGVAVLGHSDDGSGGLGPGTGVRGETAGGTGVNGTATTGYGMVAHSASGTALSAGSGTGSAVVASSGGVGYGLYLTAPSGWAIGCVGRIRVLGAAVGTATLAHGTTTKTVSSSACSSSSQVILTPTSNPQVAIWAVAAPGSFTIHASSAPGSDVTFSYFLIN